jgi:HAD superfamily hydrolase (TIGR01509 family)
MPQRETLMLPGRYRAVVFDVDGLLVTTEPVWAAAEAALLAAHGQAYTEADRRATLGRSVDASIAHYGRRIGARADELPALRAELLETFRARLAAVGAQPGARALVERLRGRIAIAVASSSSRSIVDPALDAGGLARAFDAEVTGDDVTHHKPYPEAYLLACRRLRVQPGDAIAFEDSGPGILAATAAGMDCAAVPSDSAVDTSLARFVLSSLEAVVVEPA